MITAIETELPADGQLELAALEADKPNRILVVVLEDEESTGTGDGHQTLDAFEGVYDLSRSILLLEETFLLGPKRAVVLVLDEPPKATQLDSPADHQTMTRPVNVGNIVFDLAEAAEITDQGDYVFINFGLGHQPPFLVLTDEAASQFRAVGLKVHTSEHQYLSRSELASLEEKGKRGEEVDGESVRRLVDEVRALRKGRAELMGTAAYLQWQFEQCGAIALDQAENRISKVACKNSPECTVRADSSCDCDRPSP